MAKKATSDTRSLNHQLRTLLDEARRNEDKLEMAHKKWMKLIQKQSLSDLIKESTIQYEKDLR